MLEQKHDPTPEDHGSAAAPPRPFKFRGACPHCRRPLPEGGAECDNNCKTEQCKNCKNWHYDEPGGGVRAGHNPACGKFAEPEPSEAMPGPDSMSAFTHRMFGPTRLSASGPDEVAVLLQSLGNGPEPSSRDAMRGAGFALGESITGDSKTGRPAASGPPPLDLAEDDPRTLPEDKEFDDRMAELLLQNTDALTKIKLDNLLMNGLNGGSLARTVMLLSSVVQDLLVQVAALKGTPVQSEVANELRESCAAWAQGTLAQCKTQKEVIDLVRHHLPLAKYPALLKRLGEVRHGGDSYAAALEVADITAPMLAHPDEALRSRALRALRLFDRAEIVAAWPPVPK